MQSESVEEYDLRHRSEKWVCPTSNSEEGRSGMENLSSVRLGEGGTGGMQMVA